MRNSLARPAAVQSKTRSYALVTAAYWAFMLTDGALRMLVLLHFHQLGFNPVQLAYLFLLYEIMGMITNMVAGWLGTRFGLRSTLISGLALQIVALLLLTTINAQWSTTASVLFVMLVQALSGIAKDLTKTSAKSAIKQLVPEHGSGKLFRWVAWLTGSKNAVKGLGFFLGATLLAISSFTQAVLILAALLVSVFIAISMVTGLQLGTSNRQARLRDIWATSAVIKRLAFARLFLFGARDTWFVVGVPVYLHSTAAKEFSLSTSASFFLVGAFMAVWIIGYGFAQAMTPRWFKSAQRSVPGALRTMTYWTATLLALMCILAISTITLEDFSQALVPVLITGLLLFGVVFAIVSSLHSYLILAFTSSERATMDIGFYYMANATGRLLGTLLSGISYQIGGVSACLFSAAFLVLVSWWSARRMHALIDETTPVGKTV